MAILAFTGILATCSVFSVMIPGPERGMTYYMAAGIVCVGILVFFAHLAHAKLAASGVPSATPPTRIQVQFLIALWVVFAVIAAGVAAHPKHADTFYADRVFMVYLALTFLFFVAAYFLYSKDVEVEAVSRELVEERRGLTAQLPDIEALLVAVRRVGDRFPDQAVAADRIARKVETARSAVEGVCVSSTAAFPESGNLNDDLIGQIVLLAGMSEIPADGDQAAHALARISDQADAVVTAAKKRQHVMTTGRRVLPWRCP
jgi:hypothetical protein